MDKQGNYHFHYREMNTPSRFNRIGIFFDTLYRHTLGFVSVKLNMKDLKRATARIFAPNVRMDWGYSADPHFLALSFMMDIFHQRRPEMQDYFSDDKIDFYFDNHINKQAIISSWDDNLERRPEEMRRYYGATPRFEDDKDFLPLQGADLIAGLVRRSYLEGKSVNEAAELNVQGIKRTVKKKTISLAMEFNEDQIATYLRNVLRHHIGSKHIIYDVRRL